MEPSYKNRLNYSSKYTHSFSEPDTPPPLCLANSYKNWTLITHLTLDWDTWLETPSWAHTWSWEGPMHWDSCPCTGRRPWYSSCTWYWGTSATTPSCWEGILGPTLPTPYTLSCYSYILSCYSPAPLSVCPYHFIWEA